MLRRRAAAAFVDTTTVERNEYFSSDSEADAIDEEVEKASEAARGGKPAPERRWLDDREYCVPLGLSGVGGGGGSGDDDDDEPPEPTLNMRRRGDMFYLRLRT